MVLETRPPHRKRKHKHRSLEKVGEEGFDLNLPSSKVKMPSDVYNFVKSDSSSAMPTSSPSGFTGLGERSLPSSMQNLKVVASGHGYPQALVAGKTVINIQQSQST